MNILEASYMTLVKKNRLNRKRKKRSGYRKKAEQWLAGKGSIKERHLCTIFKLYTNFFRRQGAGLEVLIKVTLKANRWKKSGKSFTKNWFLIVLFLVIKNVFHYMFAKFSYLIRTNKISSLRSQILPRTGTSCLCDIGTHSRPCDVSWLFWVYL